VQLSVQPLLGAAHHVELGRALAPLMQDGVLIVGSGHATHNLRDWMSNSRRPEPLAYVRAFSAWLALTLAAHDTDALVAYRERAPEAVRAHPSEEHFLPLFVAYGAADGHIWIVASTGRGARRVTSSPVARDFDPSWSPDGRQLVFKSVPRNAPSNWILNSHGLMPK
jgi:aromatic ring-opening dioxygenase catalytic subunit (LigB family)